VGMCWNVLLICWMSSQKEPVVAVVRFNLLLIYLTCTHFILELELGKSVVRAVEDMTQNFTFYTGFCLEYFTFFRIIVIISPLFWTFS